MMTQVEWEAMLKNIKDAVYEEFSHRFDDVDKKLEELETRLTAISVNLANSGVRSVRSKSKAKTRRKTK